MRIDKLTDWISIVANIGVLLGLFALIYELNQNNLFARAQTRGEVASSAIENVRMYQSPMGLEIIRKRSENIELTPEEETWSTLAIRSEFRAWENSYYQYRLGLLDDSELEAYKVFWRDSISPCNSPRRGWFQQFAQQIEPAFRAEVQSFIDGNDCD